MAKAKRTSGTALNEVITPVDVVNMPVYPWRTQFNNQSLPQDQQRFRSPSRTIPDQSMSVKEILNRYAKGLPLHSSKQVGEYYGDDQYYPDVAKLDLSEKQELYRATQARILELQKLMKEEEAKKHQEEIDKAREDFRKKFQEQQELFNQEKKDPGK